VFTQKTIKNVSLKNRLICSATHAGYADKEGLVTEELCLWNKNLARGGVGLIITGHAFVLPAGQASPRQIGAHADTCIPGLSRLAQSAHQEGTKIFLQLAHAGDSARKKVSGYDPCGPKTATLDDIKRMTDAFASAAERAVAAGFDGVQIHAAHGYMLSQFLSPFYNQRHDAYGGPLEARMRIVIETLTKIRAAVPADFPVIIKINSEDFLANGFRRDEMVLTCRALQEKGLDAIELSGGTPDSHELTPIRKGELNEAQECYYKDAARVLREQCSVPLILVGGMRSPRVIQELLDNKICDFIALSRPLIREPDLVDAWSKGSRHKARCISCNLCFRPLMAGRGLRCVVQDRENKQKAGR
jgi:2,4-dienoyl-CoA reductase-like NADH-dependent reductase (Old Yellow Enzyme family)